MYSVISACSSVVVVVALHSWHNHIVVRVAVILDEGAASVVAGKLNCIWVDRLHRSKESLSFMDNHSGFVIVGSSRDFSVDFGADCDISAGQRQVNAVSALGFRLMVVSVIGIVLSMGVVVSVVGVIVIVVGIVVIVVVMMIMVVMASNMDVDVRVTVVRDQGTASVVTGKLYFVDVDSIDRSNDGLSVNLNNNLVR